MNKNNRFSNLLCVFIALLLAGAAAGCEESPSSEIKVGVGETVITPPDPVGVSLRGFDRGGNTATGVHDDLHSRSIVVEDRDGNTVVLITVALISVSEENVNVIRNGIQEQTGVPVENIIISATHTHSGPSLGDPETSYARFFNERTIESAVQAWENREPGRIGFGSTDVLGSGVNRSTLRHGGIIPDPEAAVIKVEKANGDLMGVFFNYGNHPATLDLHNLLFTEDWPYFSIREIKEEIGDEVIVGYFQSAEGNINVGYSAELSAVGAYMYNVRSFEYAEHKGRMVSDAVTDILADIETVSDLDIQVSFDYFDFPRRTTYPWTHEEALSWQQEAQASLDEMEQAVPAQPTTDEEARQWQTHARELAERGELDTRNLIGPRAFDEYKVDLWLAGQAVRMSERIEQLPENPDPIRMPMQSVRLGDTVFVTFPNEVFSEIGVAVKEQSPFEKTFILGLAGGRGGYIPTAAEYLEGGYVANGSPFAPQTEQVLIDASLELINRVAGSGMDNVAERN
ncbi:MAG: neutral/alkaline non-lysosomal ceramidase N-terminal domain-containing protein [Balneolaceae bacterium]